MAYYCENCHAMLLAYNLGYCPECREPYLLPYGRGTARFCIVKTKFDNMELLIQALRALNLDVRHNADVRGKNGRQIAEVVVVLDCGCDLGYSSENGQINLVADFFGLNRYINVERLTKKINAKYLDLLAQQECDDLVL
jgi:Protein of unknown function (DUF1257)